MSLSYPCERRTIPDVQPRARHKTIANNCKQTKSDICIFNKTLKPMRTTQYPCLHNMFQLLDQFFVSLKTFDKRLANQTSNEPHLPDPVLVLIGRHGS